MVRNMPRERHLPPGYTIIYPNRDKAGSKSTKAIVVLILLVSIVLMLIVTIGGWSKLQGLKPVNFAWCIVYLIFALYITRWNRGLLPIAAALGILLLIISLIAGVGAAGTSWFDRNHAGFAGAHTLFGGSGLTPDELGLFTLLIAPVQLLLIIFAMYGFAQGWNVELEVPMEEAQRRGSKPHMPPPAPATA
jgi:nitric oxide reductase large subunit